jgi:hypothetical protein
MALATRGDAKRDHRFISFGIFSVSSLSLSLSLLLYELVDSVSAHAFVHPYREYPFCAFIL